MYAYDGWACSIEMHASSKRSSRSSKGSFSLNLVLSFKRHGKYLHLHLARPY
jgi:hypothetical protein